MGKRRFVVVIGNPPYQESDGGNKASAVPVYQKFIKEAERIFEEKLCLIIPDRWFSGGRGLDKFREDMKKDDSICYLYDFEQASDCFPGRDISGGICFFVKDRNYHGPTQFLNHRSTTIPSMMRYLNEFPVVIRSNAAVSILKKVMEKEYSSLSMKVSSQKPFGLRTYVKPEQQGELVVRWNKGKGPIRRNQIVAGEDMINKYKVIVSRLFFEHAGQPGKDGFSRVLSVLEVLKPKEVCTETYIVVNSFDNIQQAENLYKYLKTRFARYLLMQAASSIMITKNSFIFIPELDVSGNSLINWNVSIDEIDNQLYSLFELSESERNVIKGAVKEMK